MKFIFIVVFSSVISLGCKQKVLSGAELENKLVKTMQKYLDEHAKPGVSYNVKSVNYYPDQQKKLYNCEFNVEMRTEKEKIDTTGVMKANIPNDFSKVERLQ